MNVIALTMLLAVQAPGGSWEAAPLDDDVPDTPVSTPVSAPTDKGGELPILSWQKERELESIFRQSLVRLYLDLLGNPNDYGNRYSTPIPNQVGDGAYHRNGTKGRLLRMQAETDKQYKRRSGVSEATLRRMMALKQDFRPEHLRLLTHKMPRVDDVVIDVKRIQSLGGESYRIDYTVEMRLTRFSRTTRFQAVDVTYDGKKLRMPMRVLLDVSLRNERDIFGQASPAAVSTPVLAPSSASGGNSGVGGLLASLLDGSILLNLFGN